MKKSSVFFAIQRLLLLALLFWTFLGEGVTASERKAGRQEDREFGRTKGASFGLTSSREPVTINADTLEVDYKRNRIVYKGHVVASQGNITIRSDALSAEYVDGFKEMKEAVAQGHVTFTQGERVATSGRAVFNQVNGAVVMTENPRIRQGQNEVTGDRITFFLGEERTLVEGERQRVKAVIYPNQAKGSSQ